MNGVRSTMSDSSDYLELEDLETDFGYKLYLGDKVIPIPNSIPWEKFLLLFSTEALNVLKSKLTFDDINKIWTEV